MKSIYKSPQAKKEVHALYRQKADSLGFPLEEQDVDTRFGKTRVVFAGNKQGSKIVLFHGVHAGSPVTLECIQHLRSDFAIYAIDTIGQATMSAETTVNIKDDSFAVWADEVLEALAIKKADFIGISYGGYILQNLMTHRPDRINKAIMVVPGGLANGDFWPSFTRLSIPLMRFQRTKKDKHLRQFTTQFIPDDDDHMFAFQRAILTGVRLDFRRPKILQKKDVAHFDNPVYLIAADNDIFFPANKSVPRAQKVFNNLREVHLLKNCKHVPHSSHFGEIEGKIRGWLLEA